MAHTSSKARAGAAQHPPNQSESTPRSVEDSGPGAQQETEAETEDLLQGVESMNLFSFDATETADTAGGDDDDGAGASPESPHLAKSVTHLLTRRESLRDDKLVSSGGRRKSSARKASVLVMPIGGRGSTAGDAASPDSGGSANKKATRKRSVVLMLQTPAKPDESASDAASAGRASSGNAPRSLGITGAGPASSPAEVQSLMRVRSSVDAARFQQSQSQSSTTTEEHDELLDTAAFAADAFQFGDQPAAGEEPHIHVESDGDDDDAADVDGEGFGDDIEGLEGGLSGAFAPEGADDDEEDDEEAAGAAANGKFLGNKTQGHHKSLVHLVSHRKSLAIDNPDAFLSSMNRSANKERRRSSASAQRLKQLTGVGSAVTSGSFSPSASFSRPPERADVLVPEYVLAVEQEEDEIESFALTEAMARVEVYEDARRRQLPLVEAVERALVEEWAAESCSRVRANVLAAQERMFRGHRDYVLKGEQRGRTNVLADYECSLATLEGAARTLRQRLAEARAAQAAAAAPATAAIARSAGSKTAAGAAGSDPLASHDSSVFVLDDDDAGDAAAPPPQQQQQWEVAEPEEDQEVREMQLAIRAAQIKAILAAEGIHRDNTTRDETSERLAIPQERLAAHERRVRATLLAAANPPRITRLFTYYILEPLEEQGREALVVEEFHIRKVRTVAFVNRINMLALCLKEAWQRAANVAQREAKHRLRICAVAAEDSHRRVLEEEQNATIRATLLAEWMLGLAVIAVQGEKKSRVRIARAEETARAWVGSAQADEHARILRFLAAMQQVASDLTAEHETRRYRVHRSEAADRLLLAELQERGRLTCKLAARPATAPTATSASGRAARGNTTSGGGSGVLLLTFSTTNVTSNSNYTPYDPTDAEANGGGGERGGGGGGARSFSQRRSASALLLPGAGSCVAQRPAFLLSAIPQLSLSDVCADETRGRLVLESRCLADQHAQLLQARQRLRRYARKDTLLRMSPNLLQTATTTTATLDRSRCAGVVSAAATKRKDSRSPANNDRSAAAAGAMVAGEQPRTASSGGSGNEDAPLAPPLPPSFLCDAAADDALPLPSASSLPADTRKKEGTPPGGTAAAAAATNTVGFATPERPTKPPSLPRGQRAADGTTTSSSSSSAARNTSHSSSYAAGAMPAAATGTASGGRSSKGHRATDAAAASLPSSLRHNPWASVFDDAPAALRLVCSPPQKPRTPGGPSPGGNRRHLLADQQVLLHSPQPTPPQPPAAATATAAAAAPSGWKRREEAWSDKW